jgi:hypothetical protein
MREEVDDQQQVIESKRCPAVGNYQPGIGLEKICPGRREPPEIASGVDKGQPIVSPGRIALKEGKFDSAEGVERVDYAERLRVLDSYRSS